MQQIQELVAEEFASVNNLIIESLHSNVALVEDIGEYLVNAGGKRLRPMLVLLTSGACNNQDKEHIDFAVIIEFLHTATLLHDDVVDMSALRRGRPTANAQWGNASSVLVGDFIYSRAFELMAKMGNLDIIRLLALTTNQIAEGEVLQLTKVGDATTDQQAYMDVIHKKTAVLFAAACEGAAILASSNTILRQNLYNYGLNLGIAFQLIDDALDYEGNTEEMGKNIGADLAEGKPTLPLIYTIKHGSKEQSHLVKSAIKDKDNSNLQTIVSAVSACGALSYTKQQAQLYCQKAKKHLEALPPSPYKTGLTTLTDITVARTK